MKKIFKSFLRKISGKNSESDQNFQFSKTDDSIFSPGLNCKIFNSEILLIGKSKLTIHNNVTIDGYKIVLENGEMEIGDDCFLIKGDQFKIPVISVNNGKIVFGSNNVVRATVSVRFNGVLQIGKYNALNEETEIRCDESITIGDFNMFSYQCMIYDTNTHNIYPPKIRRKITMNGFPYIGMESEKPSTKPVFIGSDNWFGKRCTVLKGSNIGNEVIIGTGAIAVNLEVDKAVVVGNPGKIISPGKSYKE